MRPFNFPKRLPALALVCLAIATLTACGGSSGGSSTPITPPTPTPPVSPTAKLYLKAPLLAGVQVFQYDNLRVEIPGSRQISDATGAVNLSASALYTSVQIGQTVLANKLDLGLIPVTALTKADKAISVYDFTSAVLATYYGGVANVAALLGALDDDGDITNGIQINPTVLTAATSAQTKFDFSPIYVNFVSDPVVVAAVSSLQSLTKAGVRAMPASQAAVDTEMQAAWMKDFMAGSWAVTFTSGSFAASPGVLSTDMTISASGQVGFSSLGCAQERMAVSPSVGGYTNWGTLLNTGPQLASCVSAGTPFIDNVVNAAQFQEDGTSNGQFTVTNPKTSVQSVVSFTATKQ